MKKYLALLAVTVAMASVNSANAALMFVGYWDVADPNAPLWDEGYPVGPRAYTGQEAAAYLFGGSAYEYTISTVDDTVANIDNMAWYDVIGYGGHVFAEDYSNKYLGEFYGPSDGYSGDVTGSASAFVRDTLTQGVARNYAFRADSIPVPDPIPEPSVISLMLLGLSGLALRRRRSKAAAH